MRVLFVCLGNICRSPAAEAILRGIAPNVECDSAGTSNWHAGEPPNPPMRELVERQGYDMTSLRARQFTMADFGNFDLIVAMDARNLSDIEILRPSDDTTPVRLMTDFDPESEMDHVPDPYYTGDYDGAFELIERAVHGLRNAL